MSVGTASRLSPRDLYVRIDQLRANWHGDATLYTDPDSSKARYDDTRRQDALDVHERKIAVELRLLRRLLEHLPPRFFDRAILEYRELERGRISDDADWLGASHRLREIVGQWERSRPPIVPCPECGFGCNGQEALKSHLYTFHNIEEA